MLADTQRDLHAMDWYKCRADRYLDCPIHVVNGDRDAMTPHNEIIAGWADFTKAAMHVKLLHGSGHLFVLEKEAGPELMQYLSEVLVPQSGLPRPSLLGAAGTMTGVSRAGGASKAGGQSPPEELRGAMTRDSSTSSEP